MAITYNNNFSNGVRLIFSTLVMTRLFRLLWLLPFLYQSGAVIYYGTEDGGDYPLHIALLSGIFLASIFFIVAFSLNLIVLFFNKEFYQEKTIILSDEGLKVVESVTTNLQWKDLHKISANNRYILIYTAYQCAYIIPKRAFNIPDQGNLFFKYAYKRLMDARSN